MTSGFNAASQPLVTACNHHHTWVDVGITISRCIIWIVTITANTVGWLLWQSSVCTRLIWTTARIVPRLQMSAASRPLLTCSPLHCSTARPRLGLSAPRDVAQAYGLASLAGTQPSPACLAHYLSGSEPVCVCAPPRDRVHINESDDDPVANGGNQSCASASHVSILGGPRPSNHRR